MTEDDKITERAAKAIGLEVEWQPVHKCFWIAFGQGLPIRPWTPLTDWATAFDLLVTLGMEIARDSKANTVTVWVRRAPFQSTGTFSETERLDTDPKAATARAITRLAAMLAQG